MGLLVEGRWQDQWYESKDGTFQREQAQRRHWLTADGKPGRPVSVVLPPRPVAIISTYPSPARGPIAR